MWVVHSLDPHNHLKPGDLRRRLIEYAEDPYRALTAHENTENVPGSALEREVAARLAGLGYRVVPQWRVGHYVIDLVIENNGKRLAIECDGDRFRPLERWPDDMARLAVLERLGWTFVRIRGSQFLRDPDRALEPVLAQLRAAEIEPLAPEKNSEAVTQDLELRDRVVRRAQEIRRAWRGEDPEAAKLVPRDTRRGSPRRRAAKRPRP
jgi:very-short-patch-repair endonuclease